MEATTEQMATILGVSTASIHRAKRKGTVSLSRDQLDRVSYILNMHAALRTVFDNPENVYGFVRKRNHTPFFTLFLNSEQCVGMSEFPMYSDITVTSELLEGMGPLSFHNSLPLRQRTSGEVVIPVVVRVGYYLKPLITDFSKSSYNHYHGDWLPDEIAALMSFALGARFYAGDSIREFDAYTNDPLGNPRIYKVKN